jgi:hypothetical protein
MRLLSWPTLVTVRAVGPEFFDGRTRQEPQSVLALELPGRGPMLRGCTDAGM